MEKAKDAATVENMMKANQMANDAKSKYMPEDDDAKAQWAI